MTERKWISFCAALALGEWIASKAPQCAGVWPVAAAAAVLAALWGYGLALRGWHLAAVFLAGSALFLHSSTESELALRDKPWMRDALVRKAAGSSCGSGPSAKAVRREMSRRMGIGLGHAKVSADTNRAILLGERFRMRHEDRKRFVESGTIHVFAISGLHVMVIAKVFCVLSLLLGVSLRCTAFVALPLLWAYVWVVGMPPSAVRAALMASVYFSAPLFWRRPNALVSWSVAFAAVHIHSPRLVADVGCQLSFVVMLSIIVAARIVRKLPRVQQHLAVAFSAWASGVPIVAHVFGVVTPGGLLANLALVPISSVALISSLAGVASSYLSHALAAHFNNLAALATDLMRGISSVVSAMPCSNWVICRWGAEECLLWYAVLVGVPALALRFRSRRLF